MASPPSIPEAGAPAEFGGGGLASLPSWRRVVMAGRRTVIAVARVSSAEFANWQTKVSVVDVPLLAPLLQAMVRARKWTAPEGGWSVHGTSVHRR